ncbi:transcriptional regulator, TetR family [Fontimonas thermophila]|uniref:Transcriptional regulator, TetR family n=1 Tax=Fontimonas thermophila TaxID=1076937 RepID=A0A1I2J8L5_9GAMM|nr:TetR/AcrR family transcriptional regulator [Fontimonas thermophila]SFF51132.1 transcriptional regulator, TetR family [Fontimonas thermophila]
MPASRPPAIRKNAAPAGRELRDARAELYRQHIMAAAEKIFAEEGFAQSRMQAIAQAAGVSLGTLYQQFEGKDALYREILIARDTEMLDHIAAAAQTHLRSPLRIEQILTLMESHLRFLLEHPDYLRMQLQDGRAWYHSAARPSVAEQRIWERGLAMMRQVFDWGTANGVFVPGSAEDHARLLLAQQQARLAGWVADGMRAAHDAVIALIQADFVRCFCRPEIARRLLTPDGAALAIAVR